MKTHRIDTGARVLVADDDRAIRQLVATILRREGLQVDVAADGAEALEMLELRQYSVILLDLMMPRVDGFGVIQSLRSRHRQRHPVIIVMTAYGDHTFKDVDPQIVSGVLRKPFDVSELGSLVRLCVEGRGNVLTGAAAMESDPSAAEWPLSSPGESDGSH